MLILIFYMKKLLFMLYKKEFRSCCYRLETLISDDMKGCIRYSGFISELMASAVSLSAHR